MEKQEATRYFVLGGTSFANNAARDRCHVLDGGRWVETEKSDVLSQSHDVRHLGSEELGSLLESFSKLEKFMRESDIGDISSCLLLNRDFREIEELAAIESRELPTRTKMRGLYQRLWSDQVMLQGEIDDMERRRKAKPGWTEGGIVLFSGKVGGESKRLEAHLENGRISIRGREEGDRTEAFHGRRVREYIYGMDEANTEIFVSKFKAGYPHIIEILEIMEKVFSGPAGGALFKRICKMHGIEYTYQSI